MNTAKSHRFSLDTSRPAKLFTCPECGKKTLKRYRDNGTNDYLPEQVGRCDREINCGYHLKPKEYFSHNPSFEISTINKAIIQTAPPAEPSTIDFEIFRKSLDNYRKNNFVTYMRKLFGDITTIDIIKKYHIGTSKHYDGATVFWQIDQDKKIRTGKVMLYDTETGRRMKDKKYFNWVHSILDLREFNLQQCLFGSHLLKREPYKVVAIAESEKTATIASVYLPEMLWLATGGVSYLSEKKLQPLKHRKIILYPDLKCFEKWNDIAKQLREQGYNITTTDILETIATPHDREQGLDIADYLTRIKQPIKQVVKPPAEKKNDNILSDRSFIGKSGHLYLFHPTDTNKVAKYECIEDYNRRLHLPEYITRQEAEKDFRQWMLLSLDTLTVSMN